ncbi:MAG TPA: hypothetical protein PK748_04710 [Acidimicrobiales bacterium]|jgi:hypothetical protein|nr:sigma-70 family RNA polymerase sigma factor [Acidimicrobiales bacterium]HMS89556.1 hypothetical protein [Acidimicrobiales bacterium]HRA34201.1 hypothetical protein [Acidimicrobiales bacterium]
MSDPARTPTRRAVRDGRPPRQTAEAVDALQGFCLGPEGRAAAGAELRKLGLPASADHVDDLCQQVLVQVWARLDGGDPDVDGSLFDRVVPYARRSLRNAAVDLLRAGRRERLHDLIATSGREGADPSDRSAGNDPLGDRDDRDDRTARPWADQEADGAFAASVRWVLQVTFSERTRLDPWVASAGLVLTHLADHPDLALLPGTSRPNPRSRAAHDASRWAALAYAGRDDCFETPETGAVRQRRSTALQRVARTFTDAVHRAASDQGDAGDDAGSGS